MCYLFCIFDVMLSGFAYRDVGATNAVRSDSLDYLLVLLARIVLVAHIGDGFVVTVAVEIGCMK